MIMLTSDGVRPMPKKAHYNRKGSLARVILLAIAALTLLYTVLIQGHNVAVLNPKGFVANEQMGMILFSGLVLLAVAVPTVGALYYMAWKYRESNTKATHDPKLQASKLWLVATWAIPTVFM